jgi:Cu-Zn family superoxide dismutase
MMNILHLLSTAAGVALLTVGLALPAAAQSAKAQLKDASGKDVGTVDLTQTQAGVLLKMNVKGLPAGDHAFHVHAVGKCEPPFDSAGGHFNPNNNKHGFIAGGHAGDMPNLHIPSSGELAVDVLNPAVTLEKGKANSVFDTDGSAIIIHVNADDYQTDPTGNAGGRIACGIVSEGGATPAGAPAR